MIYINWLLLKLCVHDVLKEFLLFSQLHLSVVFRSKVSKQSYGSKDK